MGLTSLQVRMGTSEWLEGRTIHEENGLDCSPPNGEMIPCSRPLIERRLRPPHDQALKCPRCDSTHTKFCYYNNYSLSQPRYFCKTCRRYWTKGGSLRNVPVGGGCRKNKRVTTKKPTADNPLNQNQNFSSPHDVTDLHLSSYSGMHLTQLNTIMASHANPNFMLGNPRDHDFSAILGNPRNIDFMGYSDMGHGFTSNYPYGFSLDVKHGTVFESYERLVSPFEPSDDISMVEMKPSSNKVLPFGWEEQGCSQVGKESFGYMNGLGSWSGMINGYGSSATNPLV